MSKQRKEKQPPVLGRLLAYAGGHKWLSVLGCGLSGVSAAVGIFPFVFVWYAARGILTPGGVVSAGLARYGWYALAAALLSAAIYFAGLMCTHLAAFRVATNIWFWKGAWHDRADTRFFSIRKLGQRRTEHFPFGNSTMVYSEVYNMMYTPGDYIGKTIKMTGQFVYYENPDRRSCPTPMQDSTASASTRSVLARASSPAGIVCADSQAPALPVALFAVRIGSLYSPAADSPAASAGSRGAQAVQTGRNSQEQTQKHAPAQSAYEAAVPNAPHSNF